MRRVLITLVYGELIDAGIINAIFAAIHDLKKLGLEPVVVQVYNPGSRLRLSVNGVYVEPNENLVDEIVSTALEIVSYEEAVDNACFLIGKCVASTEKNIN